MTLLGNQPNPFPYMDRMDGFVLTSRYEGQGMVIWEAKALGLPLYLSKNLEAYNPGVTRLRRCRRRAQRGPETRAEGLRRSARLQCRHFRFPARTAGAVTRPMQRTGKGKGTICL